MDEEKAKASFAAAKYEEVVARHGEALGGVVLLAGMVMRAMLNGHEAGWICREKKEAPQDSLQALINEIAPLAVSVSMRVAVNLGANDDGDAVRKEVVSVFDAMLAQTNAKFATGGEDDGK